jgi:hypothetical protein
MYEPMSVTLFYADLWCYIVISCVLLFFSLIINIYDPISFQLTESVGRIQSERRQLEDEYEELRSKKDAIAQWEAQISEIIQW